MIFGITLGTSVSANQTTLYTQVAGDHIGTASGLLRTFGYLGSIASSALISIVFHTSVTDRGLHVIALVMVIVSALGVVIVVADRKLMSRARVERGPSPSSPASTYNGVPSHPPRTEPDGMDRHGSECRPSRTGRR